MHERDQYTFFGSLEVNVAVLRASQLGLILLASGDSPWLSLALPTPPLPVLPLAHLAVFFRSGVSTSSRSLLVSPSPASESLAGEIIRFM